MSERKVAIGKDSKGQYIKYRRRKIYITALAKKQIRESGLSGNALTQWLVKWIINKLTKRRRRKRSTAVNRQYSGPPKGIATALTSGKSTLPLEAQRMQAAALSLLARSPQPNSEQKRLQDLRENKVEQPQIKGPEPDKMLNLEQVFVVDDKGNRFPIPAGAASALLKQYKEGLKRTKKVVSGIKDNEQKLREAQAKLQNLLVDGGAFPASSKSNPHNLKQQLADLGITKGIGRSAEHRVNLLKAEINEISRDKTHPYYDAMLKSPFYLEMTRLNNEIEQLQKNIKDDEKGIDDAPEEADTFYSPTTAPDSPPKNAARGDQKDREYPAEYVEASAAAEELDDADAVTGAGKRLTSRSDPLADDQIDDLMSDIQGYLGTVCRDEIPELADSIKHAWGAGIPFGFITLTITRAQATGGTRQQKRPGDTGHWVAIAVIPDTQQLAYYDSFGEPAPLAIKSVLKEIFDKVAPRTLLKFKENLIQEQSVNSDNCGWFCIKFLLDMFHGREFVDATKYNQVAKSERDIEAFKKKFKPFGWL